MFIPISSKSFLFPMYKFLLSKMPVIPLPAKNLLLRDINKIKAVFLHKIYDGLRDRVVNIFLQR
jgi:hypothetical protein